MKAAVHVAVALLVNAGLFLLIAKTQTTAKARPVQEHWVVREAFTAAPPPPPPAPPEDAARVMAAEPVSQAPSAPALSSDTPAPEAFAPRLEGMAFDLGALGFGGGPPVPVFNGVGGGSPDGIPGGIVGGSPGGTGAGVLRLSQVDRGPQRMVTPLPPYPHWARVRRLEGTVTLQFTVDAEGGVKDIVVDGVDGDERFGPVAVQAVSSWRYEPGLYGGRKVPVRMIQRVRFNLVDR